MREDSYRLGGQASWWGRVAWGEEEGSAHATSEKKEKRDRPCGHGFHLLLGGWERCPLSFGESRGTGVHRSEERHRAVPRSRSSVQKDTQDRWP